MHPRLPCIIALLTDSFLQKAYYGYSDRTTPEWTLAQAHDNPMDCPGSNALDCMQTL